MHAYLSVIHASFKCTKVCKKKHVCSIGRRAHTQRTLGYAMELCNGRFQYSTAYVKLPVYITFRTTCTVPYNERYTAVCMPYLPRHMCVRTGWAPFLKARWLGLGIVKFHSHRHRPILCVYNGYISEELKERNNGRLKHTIAVFLHKVTISGKNARASKELCRLLLQL